jgi:hypothetical protein
MPGVARALFVVETYIKKEYFTYGKKVKQSRNTPMVEHGGEDE